MSDTIYFNDRTWTVDELAALAGPLHIRGDLDLNGYAHPLPATLTSVGGNLYLRGYTHPLPAGLAHRDTRTVAR